MFYSRVRQIVLSDYNRIFAACDRHLMKSRKHATGFIVSYDKHELRYEGHSGVFISFL